MRILIATDAWHPQINGVVRSLEQTAAAARGLGAEVEFLTPQGLRSVPLPTYGEIRLALTRPATIARRIAAIRPDHIHIATEGPIGLMTRRWCLRAGEPFTTSYHTRFPEYLSARLPVPERWSYALLRRFHNAGTGVMVSTPTLEAELAARGFSNIMRWSRGVDAALYRPRPEVDLGLKGPVFLYVGRVAVEKNIEAFLKLDLPGTKLIVGGGPQLDSLRAVYPDAVFVGPQTGEALARFYAGADVFVFPSRTDTFGIVLLEALASGLPIAAYPVMGPRDVVGDAPVGVLDEDLRAACLGALKLSRDECRAFALQHSWEACARQFIDNIERAHGAALARAA